MKKAKPSIASLQRRVKALQNSFDFNAEHRNDMEKSFQDAKRRLDLSEKNVQSLIARVAQEQERYGRLEQRCQELLDQLSEVERNRPHRKLKRFFRLEK